MKTIDLPGDMPGWFEVWAKQIELHIAVNDAVDYTHGHKIGASEAKIEFDTVEDIDTLIAALEDVKRVWMDNKDRVVVVSNEEFKYQFDFGKPDIDIDDHSYDAVRYGMSVSEVKNLTWFNRLIRWVRKDNTHAK
jgi:hypothetical protein